MKKLGEKQNNKNQREGKGKTNLRGRESVKTCPKCKN